MAFLKFKTDDSDISIWSRSIVAVEERIITRIEGSETHSYLSVVGIERRILVKETAKKVLELIANADEMSKAKADN